MNPIFDLVVKMLYGIASLTGLSYEEINVIIYFMLIPLIYIALIDKLFNKHYFKLVYLGSILIFILAIPDFNQFSKWLFIKSQLFLRAFSRIGWNYAEASVIICVILPFIFLCFLIWLNWRDKINNFFDNLIHDN